ncbi:general substrate transporter [Xylaria arbuscula]|nr:general substrate transporter [Xylaria arbuscula]
MVYVDSLEKAATKGTTYLDCFRGTNGRRTELACIAWVADAICGAVLGGLTVSLYSKAGISFRIQVSVRLGFSILALATTITTWFIMNKIGRKSLLLGGVCAAMTTLLVAGLLGIPKDLSDTGAIVAGTLLMVLSVIGSIISPVIYTIVAEIPSTRLRIKTIALARGAYHIANAGLVATITEKQLDRRGWNWGLKSCLFWAGINLILAIYIHLRLPETKGRTYAELSILFENKVPARKFKAAQVGPIKFSNGHGRDDLAIRIANTSALEYQTRNLATMTA